MTRLDILEGNYGFRMKDESENWKWEGWRREAITEIVGSDEIKGMEKREWTRIWCPISCGREGEGWDLDSWLIA